MIFSMADHIEQILKGTKTQTRRKSGKYRVGRKYGIQPGYSKPNIADGKIYIVDKKIESRVYDKISVEDAKAEGGYSPEEPYRRVANPIASATNVCAFS